MKYFFSKHHFLGVVFNGESHGDIHFNSKRRRYTVLIANSSQAVTLPFIWCLRPTSVEPSAPTVVASFVVGSDTSTRAT